MDLIETSESPAPSGARIEAVTTADGVRLRVAFWPGRGETRTGTVLLVGGRTEFIEKYFETVGDLLDRGFAVVAFDWRGHGQSDREIADECHVESFDQYDRDLDAVMRAVVLPDGPSPLFALAHSLGALVTLRAAAEGRARFTRIVLTAPMLGLSRLSTPPGWLLRTAMWLRLFVGGDYWIAANRALRSRDTIEPEPRQRRVAKLLEIAPQLRTGRPTTRWVYATLQAIRRAEKPGFAAAIRCPVLMIGAGRDRVVSNDAIERFAGNLRFGAHLLVPGARHELLLEQDAVRQEFWAGFDAFIPGTDPFAG